MCVEVSGEQLFGGQVRVRHMVDLAQIFPRSLYVPEFDVVLVLVLDVTHGTAPPVITVTSRGQAYDISDVSGCFAPPDGEEPRWFQDLLVEALPEHRTVPPSELDVSLPQTHWTSAGSEREPLFTTFRARLNSEGPQLLAIRYRMDPRPTRFAPQDPSLHFTIVGVSGVLPSIGAAVDAADTAPLHRARLDALEATSLLSAPDADWTYDLFLLPNPELQTLTFDSPTSTVRPLGGTSSPWPAPSVVHRVVPPRGFSSVTFQCELPARAELLEGPQPPGDGVLQ